MHIWLSRVLGSFAESINLSYLFKIVLIFCQIFLSSLVYPKCYKFLSNTLELLGTPQVLQAFCCHFEVFLLEIGMSRFPIASSFSCSVLSITGDTAKYLDFIIFCRSCTLYPHVTIPSCCHQWPTGLVLTKMEYWQIENVTKSFQKVLPYIISSFVFSPHEAFQIPMSSN